MKLTILFIVLFSSTSVFSEWCTGIPQRIKSMDNLRSAFDIVHNEIPNMELFLKKVSELPCKDQEKEIADIEKKHLDIKPEIEAKKTRMIRFLQAEQAVKQIDTDQITDLILKEVVIMLQGGK